MTKSSQEKPHTLSDLCIVGGCGSSGTTLLAHIVSKHEKIGSGPEFNCFNHLELYDFDSFKKELTNLQVGRAKPSGYVDVPVFMTFQDHYGVHHELIHEWVAQSSSSLEFICLLRDHLLDHFRCEIFFEKSPTNAYCLNAAGKTLNGVKLVHMVRDGRDVVCSLMKRGWNLFGAGSRWLYDTVQGLEARNNPNYMELRYEEFVSDPGSVLNELFSHLNVSKTANDLIDSKKEVPGLYSEEWTNRSEPNAWNQTPSDPISTNSIGRYKEKLSKGELNYLNKIKIKRSVDIAQDTPRTFGELLEYLDYPRSVEQNSITESSKSINNFYRVSDYLRRVRRFHNRNYWNLPQIYTY
ncbi:MAG: sulfotransferase [Candidatus Thiodiazotropha taylori]